MRCILTALAARFGKRDDEIFDVLEHVLAGLYPSHGCSYAYGAGTSFLAPLFGRRSAKAQRVKGYSNFYSLCIIWAESLMIPSICMK